MGINFVMSKLDKNVSIKIIIVAISKFVTSRRRIILNGCSTKLISLSSKVTLTKGLSK